jgi:uncharacterized protein DUF4349
MTSKFNTLVFSFLLLGFAGCQMAHKNTAVDRAETTAYMTVSGLAGSPQNAMYLSAVLPDASHRFIATRHKLEILSREAELPKGWESIINFCASIQCEVIASSLTARTRESSASGSVAMRVAPQDFPKLFAQAEKQGNIVQHTTESEDKTSAVVDTEAKLKNLIAYRDSLRTMLGKPGVTVKDLVEIQGKLTDVQSQLDSETATRKILANETEKIAVEINFRVERAASRGSFTPIWEAFRESGSNLAESLATLITVIVSIIPWLIVIVPGFWVLAKYWRQIRRKKNITASSAAL